MGTRVVGLLALLAVVVRAEAFGALAGSGYSYFAEFSWHNEWLNFNFEYAGFSLKLSVVADFTSWLAGDALAGRLDYIFLHGSWSFLATATLGWSDVAFAWWCAVECLFANAAVAFQFEAVGAYVFWSFAFLAYTLIALGDCSSRADCMGWALDFLGA